jgi:hypothetical protein
MAPVTRQIGLSLGADICWPLCYEGLLQRLDLALPLGDETVRFAAERVTVEPYDLQYEPKYDLVFDRVTHWFPMTREWIKKIALMDGTYVLNNPWAIQSMEKHTSYCAMLRLGFPVPRTLLIPAKEYKDEGDTKVTVARYNKLFDLEAVGAELGYPAFFKPYDGGGWRGVERVTNGAELRRAYDKSGTTVNHLQAAIDGWEIFVRGIGVGPQVNVMRYDPDKPLHDRYRIDFNFLEGKDWLTAIRTTRVINAFFAWDFNSCEMLKKGSVLHPIDFANACPDSQVTSLHFHFPWLVKALLKWTIFCAATRRKPTLEFHWQPYFDIADLDLEFSEKLERYDVLARQHFDTERFDQFCAEHLAHLDDVALDFFGSELFKEAVQAKVEALYPKHEVQQFTDHFFGLVQFWRKTEMDRVAAEKQVAEVPEKKPVEASEKKSRGKRP